MFFDQRSFLLTVAVSVADQQRASAIHKCSCRLGEVILPSWVLKADERSPKERLNSYATWQHKNSERILAVGTWAITFLSAPTGCVQLALHLLQISRSAGKSDLIRSCTCVLVFCCPLMLIGLFSFLSSSFFSSFPLFSVVFDGPLQIPTSYPVQSSVTPPETVHLPTAFPPLPCCFQPASIQCVCADTEVWLLQANTSIIMSQIFCFSAVGFLLFFFSIPYPTTLWKKCTAACHEL